MASSCGFLSSFVYLFLLLFTASCPCGLLPSSTSCSCSLVSSFRSSACPTSKSCHIVHDADLTTFWATSFGWILLMMPFTTSFCPVCKFWGGYKGPSTTAHLDTKDLFLALRLEKLPFNAMEVNEESPESWPCLYFTRHPISTNICKYLNENATVAMKENFTTPTINYREVNLDSGTSRPPFSTQQIYAHCDILDPEWT